MLILLTGEPHCGKTTILQKVGNTVKHPVAGVITYGVVDDPITDHRSAFVVRTKDGDEWILAQRDPIPNSPQIGNWYVDINSLENNIVPSLEKALAQKNSLTLIDEIAKIEMASTKFRSLIPKIGASTNHILATIAEYQTQELAYFSSIPEVSICTVTNENRDLLPDLLISIYDPLLTWEKLLTQPQIKKITQWSKIFFENKEYTQLSKLFTHTLQYICEKRAITINKNIHVVKGNHDDYIVNYTSGIETATCTCDLFLGKNEYNSSPGICSHIMTVALST